MRAKGERTDWEEEVEEATKRGQLAQRDVEDQHRRVY